MTAAPGERYQVWIDQSLCTGDGLCVQEAGNVFEFDIDGLAYVKNADGELLTEPGARADVPADTFDEVVLSARKCPGLCIHVVRVSDGVEVEGPDAAG
ncbi:MAG TPA: ferredoxin [Acidothermaceae bacterium]